MAPSLGLTASTRLATTTTVTPQQLLYLKLISQPLAELEQYLEREIAENPLLEVAEDDEAEPALLAEPAESDPEPLYGGIEADIREPASEESYDDPFEVSGDDYAAPADTSADEFSWQDYVEDDDRVASRRDDDDDDGPIPIRADETFQEQLIQQLRLFPLEPSLFLLGQEMIWSVDASGYLRADDYGNTIDDIVDRVNDGIREENRKRAYAAEDDIFGDEPELLRYVDSDDAEKVRTLIRYLDPPGFASKDLRECLLSQLDAVKKPNAAQKLASMVLRDCYHSFTMKHYDAICKELSIDIAYLREALEVIRKLNPKPGPGAASVGTSSVIPDFFVSYVAEIDDFEIRLNDDRVPPVRVTKKYDQMRKNLGRKHAETKRWFNDKLQNARALVNAIQQRRKTMIDVMTSIVHHQRDAFAEGMEKMKPLIYKTIAEDTGNDISTISRLVREKYVQNEFGVFSLRDFFSEGIENEDGDVIATAVIKQELKKLVEGESKKRPLSDDRLSQELTKLGYPVARRTVAKYREQLKIPPARMRKEA